MFGFIQRFLAGAPESRTLAKNRLQFVLVQDRAGLSNEELSRFKRELIEVIERYFQIDEEAFDISYRRESEMTTLQINSPVLVKRAVKRVASALVVEKIITPEVHASPAQEDTENPFVPSEFPNLFDSPSSSPQSSTILNVDAQSTPETAEDKKTESAPEASTII